jgi:HK97 family phage prohead protease
MTTTTRSRAVSETTTPPPAPPVLRRALEHPRHAGERRAVARLEDPVLRDASGTGDGSYTFSGRAVVYDQWTTLYEGESFFGGRLRVRERILPGALSEVLASGPEVHFNHGHDMKTAMARLSVVGQYGEVRRGGMKLWETAAGLDVFARLNPELSHVRDLKAQMDDGIVDQMSFAFRIGKEDYETYTEGEGDDAVTVYDWTVETCSALFDVCACAQGAYPTTSAQLRSAIETLRRHPGLVPEGTPTRHASAGEPTVTQTAGGPSAALRARARAALVTYPRR